MTKQKVEALPQRLSNATLGFPVVTWTSVQTKLPTRKRRRERRHGKEGGLAVKGHLWYQPPLFSAV